MSRSLIKLESLAFYAEYLVRANLTPPNNHRATYMLTLIFKEGGVQNVYYADKAAALESYNLIVKAMECNDAD